VSQASYILERRAGVSSVAVVAHYQLQDDWQSVNSSSRPSDTHYTSLSYTVSTPSHTASNLQVPDHGQSIKLVVSDVQPSGTFGVVVGVGRLTRPPDISQERTKNIVRQRGKRQCRKATQVARKRNTRSEGRAKREERRGDGKRSREVRESKFMRGTRVV